MPSSGTPQKKKWIKRFNRENGNGTPLLKQKKLDSAKKLKSSIGDVLKAGQNFFFGNSVTNNPTDVTKSNKLNKNLFKDSEKNNLNDEQIYKKFSPNVFEDNLKASDWSIDDSKSVEKKEENVTPLSSTFDNANKKVRKSVRKIGSREPIIM